MLELLKEAVITPVSNAVAAGTSLVTSTQVDMAGFDAVTFVVKLNTVVDASVLTLSALGVGTNTNTGGTLVAGAAAGPFTASTSSNTVLVVDVIRPKQRWVYCTLARTAQNATIDSIIAIQYRASNAPTTQPVSVVASALSTPEV